MHHSDHLSVEGIVCELIVTGPVYEVLSLHDDVVLTNQRPVFRSRDQYWPIRGQYPGHVTSIDQSEASTHLHDDVATHTLVHTGLKGPRGDESDKTKEINKELSTGFSTKLKFPT